MPETMLNLICPKCKEDFILYYKESNSKIKNSKKPKNLTKLFLKNVEKAIDNPKFTDLVHTKFHYEITK